MKRFIFVVMLLVSSMYSVASTESTQIDVSKLSPEVQAVVKKELQSNSDSIVTPEKVNDYLEIGSKFGKVLADTAKEMNIAVNDFIKTPAGFLVAATVFWAFAGKSFILVIVGCTLILFAMCFLVLGWRGSCTYNYTTIENVNDIFGRLKIFKTLKSVDTETLIYWSIFSCVCLLGAWIALAHA